MPTPIYDSGKCLFVHDSVPSNDRGLLSIKTESFASDELKFLKLVSDRNCLDVMKLPPRSFIEEIYSMDTQMDEKRIVMIGEGYERKIELFREFQLGNDINKIKMAVRSMSVAPLVMEDVVIYGENNMEI